MLKLLKKHTFYEVWNERNAESIYVDHKPTKDELRYLVTKFWSSARGSYKYMVDEYIAQFILVRKERRVYTSTAAAKRAKYRMERGNDNQLLSCSYCNGLGTKSDDSYATFKCPFCKGTGTQ